MSPLTTGLIVAAVVAVLTAAFLFGGRWLRRRMLDPPGVRAAAQALRTAGLAAPPLRDGLTSKSSEQALPHLLALLDQFPCRPLAQRSRPKNNVQFSGLRVHLESSI